MHIHNVQNITGISHAFSVRKGFLLRKRFAVLLETKLFAKEVGPMIRVALVEDEESSQRTLTEYLERFSQEINEKIHVSIFPDGAESSRTTAAITISSSWTS